MFVFFLKPGHQALEFAMHSGGAMVVLLVLLLVALHLRLTWHDLVDFQRRICQWRERDATVDLLKEARVEEGSI